MSATAIAISGAATAQAAAANARAAEADRLACMSFVHGYQHDTASVQEMRQYAGCVGRLHPEPMSESDVTGWKVVVALVLLGSFAGIWWARKHTGGDAIDYVMGYLMGAMFTAVALGVIGLVYLGVRFLFS